MSGEIEASNPGLTFGRIVGSLISVLVLLAPAAEGQTLIAYDDTFAVPYADTLLVEAPGVLENDTYHGEPAEGAGATVELVGNVSYGYLSCPDTALKLCPDGSFVYTPDPDYPGTDTFTYLVTVGTETALATVTLTACSAGPTQYVCWKEAPYLAKLGDLGYQSFQEGFEDDAAWGVVRSPDTALSVVNQGIEWQTNFPDPPASNGITTSMGAARTGFWGVYDSAHGYATGTPTECDVDVPPPGCLFKDGFTGTRQSGESTLYGVGGYFTGQSLSNLVMILDGGTPLALGRLSAVGHQFFGVIDIVGFTSFRVEETDGKVGQELYVFADDFTFAFSGPFSIFSDGFESGGTLAWSTTYP